jgi:Zn-finger nucleic acid-binding protein
MQKIFESLNMICPPCEETLTPADTMRLDWTQMQCLKCKGVFVPEQKGRGGSLGLAGQ